MNKWGSVNYGNCIISTAGGGGGGGGVWGQWWFEVRMVTSQGTNSRDRRPGNRSLSLLFAGVGTICRTEPAEIPDARGEPFWGMRSRLAQGLWDQREQCFATKSGFLVQSDIHLSAWFSKWGTRELWGGCGNPTFGSCPKSLVPGHRCCHSVIIPPRQHLLLTALDV